MLFKTYSSGFSYEPGTKVLSPKNWSSDYNPKMAKDISEKYNLIWSYYKEVAEEHNINLPYRWLVISTILKGPCSNRHNTLTLAPIGDVVHVNYEYDISIGMNPANVLYERNYRRMAENFFMVDSRISVSQYLASNYNQSVIARKWKVIKYDKGYTK